VLPYIGRFAPSPTGPLHAGSLVAALASWLDARAHRGRWLVRIEDVDAPRCVPGADKQILNQLSALGLAPDEPPQWQSRRGALYEAALARLVASAQAYGCACTRFDIAAFWRAQGQPRERHAELVYPGTCRPEQGGQGTRTPRTWRLRLPHMAVVDWHDRRLGPQQQDASAEVGDFVLKRADGLWAYQLAVVVDDAEQGITHVVRGADLADNTARQILLQRALDLSTPHYLHTPLVLAADGQKLSKQNGAQALDLHEPLAALRTAGARLDLSIEPCAGAPVSDWLVAATRVWRARYD
jgi:glutamyl-Q tRNA(Asp) synthetase